MDSRTSDLFSYWTHKVIKEPPICEAFNSNMINLEALDEPDSEEAVYTQHVVMKTKDRLFAPKVADSLQKSKMLKTLQLNRWNTTSPSSTPM